MNIVVLTDCEPDDFVALWALEKAFPDAKVTVIITDTTPEQARTLATMLPASWARAYYPSGRRAKYANLPSDPDAPEIAVATAAPWDVYAIADVFLFMSPLTAFTELCNLGLLNPKAAAAIYGSFNLRCVKTREQTVAHINNYFARTLYIETFTTIGEKTTANHTTAHKLLASLERGNSEMSLAFLKLRDQWNTQILESQRKKVAEGKDEGGRATKVIAAIEAANEQFIMADPLLIAFLPAFLGHANGFFRRVAISYEGAYPTLTNRDADGNGGLWTTVTAGNWDYVLAVLTQ